MALLKSERSAMTFVWVAPLLTAVAMPMFLFSRIAMALEIVPALTFYLSFTRAFDSGTTLKAGFGLAAAWSLLVFAFPFFFFGLLGTMH